MKTLLILPPKIEYGERSSHLFSNIGSVLPIGLAYLAAVLEKAGHSVKIFDFQLSYISHEKLKEELEKGIDVVGISITTFTSGSGYKIASFVKEISPKTLVVMGGPHTTALGSEVLDECKNADFFVFGEGEITLVELLEAIDKNKPFGEVDGIGFWEGNKKVITKPRKFIEDLDSLPIPAYHLFDVAKYRPVMGMFKKLPFANIMASRGCPFDCTFCNKLVWGYKLRLRSPKNIVDEMVFLKERYNVKEIAFFDDTFTINRSRTIEICKDIKNRAKDIIWKCSARVDTVDKELLAIMKEAGCYSIGYGIESGNQEILNNICKKITLEQSKNAVKWAKEVGMEVRAYFMLNIPGDTIETTEQTIEFSRELDPDFVDFEIVHPYPNTVLWRMIENNPKYHIIKEKWKNWEAHAGNDIIFIQDSLPVDYLKESYINANRGFYLRPTKILKILGRVSNIYRLEAGVRAFWNILHAKVPR